MSSEGFNDSTQLLNSYPSGIINYGNVDVSPSLTDSSGALIDVTQVYKRRWYILLLFSLLAMIQNMIWNTWSPISISAEAVFKFTTFDLGLFVNWGTICFVVFLLPLAWLINTKGLRISLLVAAFTTSLGAAFRCFTTEQIPATWLVNIGQFLNGVGGPVIMSTPSAISAVWFPEFQRTTATAIAASSQGIGVAISFLVGPLLVSEPNLTASAFGENSTNSSATYDEQRKQIMNLMYTEFGIAVTIFLLFVIYFPKEPPKPPTISASVPRFNFKEGFCKLVRNRKYWLICVSAGIYNGFLVALIAVLGPFLAKKDFNQVESGWLGFYALIAAQAGGLILSWFLDKLSQQMKLTIVIFKIIYFGMCVWLLLIWRNIMPSSKVYIYVVYILLSISNLGLVPAFYELSIESLYPINEGVITGILNMFVNGFMVIFLGLQMILSSDSLAASIGNEWMIWCLLGSVVISLPSILFFKGIYSRLHVDKSYRKSVTSQK